MTFFGLGKDDTPPRYKTPSKDKDKDKTPQKKKPATGVKSPPRKTAVVERTPPPMRMGATAVPKLTPSGKMQVPKSPLQKTSRSDSRFSQHPSRASVLPGRPSVAMPSFLNRPSVVPHPVTRPSIFSLAQQSHLSGGRASVMHPGAGGGGGKQHQAVAFFNEPSVMKPEDRKLDKAMVAAMAKKVWHFLNALPDLPFTITEKRLRDDPSTVDFVNVFSAVYGCIAPGYSGPNKAKLEVDVPPILAALGYPYRVEKKCFVPLGAPHSWKFLLAAIAWLVDMVEAVKAQGNSYETVKRVPSMTYAINCYRELKELPTETSDMSLLTDLLDNYRQMAMCDEGLSIEEYEGMKKRREQQAVKLAQCEEAMEKEDEELTQLEKEIADFEQDINAISDYVEKNRVQTGTLDEITDENAARIHRMSEQLAAINASNHHKEERIAQQPVSGEEVRQLNAERQNLRALINTTRTAVEKREQLCFENQPRAFEISNKLRTKFKTFVSHLRELCNQLLDEHSISSLDWAACEIEAEHLTSDEFIGQTHNALFQLIAEIKSAVEESIDRMRQLQDEISRKAEEGTRQLSQLEADKGKIATEHKLKMEQLMRDVKVAGEKARDASQELDIVKANHERISDELAGLMERMAEVGEQRAGEERRFIQEKTELTKLFDTIKESWKKKMEELRITFHQLCRHKQELKDLGERLLAVNSKTIEELRKNESDFHSPRRKDQRRK